LKLEIDKDKIESKLTELKSYVDTLKKAQGLSTKELASDSIKLGGIKYYLQNSIECCLDIGAHLISRLGLRRFEGYKEIFTILGEAGIIPIEFVPTLREMAGFRKNMLVHVYWEVDVRKVSEILNHNLEDFERFASYIARFLLNKQENKN
jgi:uncharacterized protein YutE (UPF0331/DUF86 family)